MNFLNVFFCPQGQFCHRYYNWTRSTVNLLDLNRPLVWPVRRTFARQWWYLCGWVVHGSCSSEASRGCSNVIKQKDLVFYLFLTWIREVTEPSDTSTTNTVSYRSLQLSYSVTYSRWNASCWYTWMHYIEWDKNLFWPLFSIGECYRDVWPLIF